MDLMKKEVIVLNATQYQMTDTETGEINEGTSVRYLMTNNLAPCAEEQQKGYKLIKARVGFNNFNDFPEVPGVYDADLESGSIRMDVGNGCCQQLHFQEVIDR